MSKAFTAKKLRGSIKRDKINPADYLKYDFRFSCEDCSHFCSQAQSCTIGYESKWHRKEFQTYEYELAGHMALCRFQEID